MISEGLNIYLDVKGLQSPTVTCGLLIGTMSSWSLNQSRRSALEVLLWMIEG